MAKSDTIFVCQSCGAVAAKWAGKCESCGSWNTMVEETVRAATPGALSGPSSSGRKTRGINFTELSGAPDPPPRLATGIPELDRVCGGGLVPASGRR
jgi:DNA repair protein RadA/Sms